MRVEEVVAPGGLGSGVEEIGKVFVEFNSENAGPGLSQRLSNVVVEIVDSFE